MVNQLGAVHIYDQLRTDRAISPKNSGHRVMTELGLRSVPVFPVNSNCSTG